MPNSNKLGASSNRDAQLVSFRYLPTSVYSSSASNYQFQPEEVNQGPTPPQQLTKEQPLSTHKRASTCCCAVSNSSASSLSNLFDETATSDDVKVTSSSPLSFLPSPLCCCWPILLLCRRARSYSLVHIYCLLCIFMNHRIIWSRVFGGGRKCIQLNISYHFTLQNVFSMFYFPASAC